MSSSPFTNLVDKRQIPSASKASKQNYAGAAEVEANLKSTNHKQLKTLLRNHHWPVDHATRGVLWHSLGQTLQANQHVSIYQEMLTEIPSQSDLPSFVDSSHMHHYLLNNEGKAAARRIMQVISNTKPDITFSPLIFPLTCALLHYIDEESCYNCLYAMLTTNAQDYITQTRKSYEVGKFVLKDLTRKYAKTSFQVMFKSGRPVEEEVGGWLWWIFKCLPFSYLVRVIDCYLLEGTKVLYRVALAILILHQKNLSKSSPKKNATVRAQDIEEFCRNINVPVDKLLKTAFGIRGLSRQEIRKMMLKTQMFLDSIDNVQARPAGPLVRSASLNNVQAKPSAMKASPSLALTDLPVSQIVRRDSVDGLSPLPRSRSRSQGVLPLADVESTILTLKHWQTLWEWLPRRYTICQPKLLFTTSEHGTSLRTFYQRCEGHEPTIILIKTTKNQVFGAFCSTDWEERKHSDQNLSYFGTGESFVFTIVPQVKKYEWVGIKLGANTPNSAHLFMAGDTSKLTIGGGNGEAMQIDENCYRGWTSHCDTFDNRPLCEGGSFICSVLEVFGVQ